MLARILFIAALAATPWAQSHAQAHPSKPVHLVSAFAPGGTTDILARLVADKLREPLGQPVVVENRPGAGGNIGSDHVAKSAPDGYTLLFAASGPMAVNPWLFDKMPFEPLRDFVPIAQVAAAPLVVVVPASSPYQTFADFLAAARKASPPLTFASAGPGSPQHITAELFKHEARVDMLHVPYKSAGQAITDLLAGHVVVSFEAMIPVLPHVKSGRLRALAVTSAQPNALLPGVPTVAASGVPGFESVAWYGIVAPKGTPADVVKRLNGELVTMLNQPDVRERLASMGSPEVVASTPDAFGKLLRNEHAKWGKVVKTAGIKLE